jgi:hypothetical protein
MRKLMPDLPGDLLDYETGKPSDYEGVVIPIEDLRSTTVFWMPNDKDPYVKGRAFQNFLTELGRQIWQSVRETVNVAKEGDGARIVVHWASEADVKPLPEEIER